MAVAKGEVAAEVADVGGGDNVGSRLTARSARHCYLIK